MNFASGARPASTGIRFLALSVDWMASTLTITGLTGKNYGFEGERLLLFFVEVSLLTALIGASAGQRLLRLKVVDANTGGSVDPLRVLIRTLLIVLVIPALFKKDGVAYHDAICKTIVIRA